MSEETATDVLADALRTEYLYINGNPEYVAPSSTVALLLNAADALDRLTLYETALRKLRS